jgi:hypothetical protein
VAEVIYAFLLAIGNLVGLARLKSTHGKRLDKVESDLEKHTEFGELYRNRDFERRLDAITVRNVGSGSSIALHQLAARTS